MRPLLVLLVLTGCGPKKPVSTAPTTSTMPTATAPTTAPPASTTPTTTTTTSTLPSAVPPTVAPPPAPARTVKDDLDDAIAPLTTRSEAGARESLDKLQALQTAHPDVALIPYNMGVARIILGDETEARRNWLRATEIDPTLGSAWQDLAALEARRGRYDVALANLQSGVRNAPQDMNLRVAQISILRTLKRPDDAVVAARSALQVNSMALGVYTSLSEVYLDQGKLDLAKFVIDKALQSVSGAENNARIHADRGEVFRRQGYSADALQEFQKALTLDPNQVGALGFVAKYYLDNHDWVDAAAPLERLVQLQPDSAGARVSLGIAYRGLGRTADAEKLYNQALQIDPTNPEPIRNLAILYGDYLHDYPKALGYIDQYRQAGGGPAADLDAWTTALKKDQEKAERRKKKEAEEAAKRAAAAAQPPPEPTPTPAPAPQEPAPTPAPAPQEPAPTPAPQDPNSPWGSGGGG